MPRDGKQPESLDLQREFQNADRPAPPAPEPATPEHEDDGLDHLEYTLDYTPGGSIEQIVNTELSERARAAYRERQQPTFDSNSEYERQIDRQFERAAADDETQRATQERLDEQEIEEDPAVDGFGEKDPERQSQRQERAEIEQLVTETDKEPSHWHDDPQKAAEYLEWSKQQEAERSDEQHEQMLDRLAEERGEARDVDEPSPGDSVSGSQGNYPRLYRGEEGEREVDPTVADPSEWEHNSGSDLRDAWDGHASPELSPESGWDAPGHESGGHDH